MQKIITEIINNCYECPYAVDRDNVIMEYQCNNDGNDITKYYKKEPYGIHPDCPLEDYKEVKIINIGI
jgi:hypothetical protein